MSLNAHELWNSFREILRDASFFPENPPHHSSQETLRTVKALAFEVAPEDLRVIDQELLELRKASLSPRYIELLSELRRSSGLEELSQDELRAREIERSAILKPIEVMSFPHPEVRVALLARFGPASSSGCLRDIYDLDSDIEVKTEVMHTVHRRLRREELNASPQERRALISFAEEVVTAGFYHGIDIEPAKAALAILRGCEEAALPRPIQGVQTTYWPHASLEGLTLPERIGVVRFYGDYMTAPELVGYLEQEDDAQLQAVILENLEKNWDLGVEPDGSATPLARGVISRRIADILLKKLGLDELPSGVRDDLLRAEPWESEPPAIDRMRRLTIRALSDIESD